MEGEGGSGTECGRRLDGRPYLRSVLPGLEVTGKNTPVSDGHHSQEVGWESQSVTHPVGDIHQYRRERSLEDKGSIHGGDRKNGSGED